VQSKPEESKQPRVQSEFSAEFKKQIEEAKSISESDVFGEFVGKEEITFVIFVNSDPKSGVFRFVTTSNDGFIKLNEVDCKTNKYTCKKSLFVCGSGISVACQLSGD